MGSAFHQLCPIYSGTLTPLPLRLLDYGNALPLPTLASRTLHSLCKKMYVLTSLLALLSAVLHCPLLCKGEGKKRKISIQKFSI